MSSKSKRLGTLADVYRAESLDGTIRKIRMDRISPAEHQPRQERKKGIEELASSLAQEGLLQPIVVSKSRTDENYQIIAGERRFHAAKSLGWPEIECKILDRPEKEIYKLAIIENLQRENLSPYEEIEALHYLKQLHSYSDSDLGGLFGKSRNYMSEILSIASLSKEEIKLCKDKDIQSKNLLVQAAQASKKGSFQEFLDLYSQGQLRTVRDAKEFNRAEKKEALPKEGISPFQIKRNGNQISITSEDEILLGEILKFLRKELPKHWSNSL